MTVPPHVLTYNKGVPCSFPAALCFISVHSSPAQRARARSRGARCVRWRGRVSQSRRRKVSAGRVAPRASVRALLNEPEEYLRRNVLKRTLPEHMRAGSLSVDKLRQQLRHCAAAATTLVTGVTTGVGAAGRERLQQPPQQQEAGGPQEEEGHEAPSVAQLVEVVCGEGCSRQPPRHQ
eukprot:scaffold28911_cov62-Phaeocystis_antarctica.AAC.3